MFLCVLVQCASGYTISISCLGRVASSPFGGDAARRGCDFKRVVSFFRFLVFVVRALHSYTCLTAATHYTILRIHTGCIDYRL